MQYRQDPLKNKSLLSSSTKFSAYKIQKNKINRRSQAEDEQYKFEQYLTSSINYSVFKQRQNITQKNVGPIARQKQKTPIPRHNEEKAKSLMEQLFFHIPKLANNRFQNQQNPTEQQISNSKQALQKNQSLLNQKQEQGLTDLWNQIQGQVQPQQKRVSEFQQNRAGGKQQQSIVQHNNRIQVCQNIVHCDSSSSCQLTQQQLRQWMQKCEQIQEQKGVNVSWHSHRNNCIYHVDESEQIYDKNQKTQQKLNESENQWGQWAEMVQFMQNQVTSSNTNVLYGNQILGTVSNKKQAQGLDQFIIIDSPCKSNQQYKENNVNQTEKQIKQFYQQKKSVYGPWNLDLSFYKLFPNYDFKQIHKQYLDFYVGDDQKLSSQQLKQIYNSARTIRKINWEIQQQKNPQVRKLRSKRNCRMNLIQYGKNFLIFDHAKFVLSPIREGTHLYLGVRSFGNFQQFIEKQNNSSKLKALPSIKQNKQYLYLPANGQCLIQTVHPINSSSNRKLNLFDLYLSLTGQKIAVCQRKIINQQRDKRQIIEVKYFDQFQQSTLHYLGIIQCKTSNFSGQWYCDTIIYVPKDKLYSNKINEQNWYSFKIQIRLSQVGTIVAELGIFDAESSVTNCILFGENKYDQFMMGTILQNIREINYILRIAGISPLMAFVAALSRKLFVYS